MTAEEIELIGLESVEDLLYGRENCKHETPAKDKQFLGYMNDIDNIREIMLDFAYNNSISINTKIVTSYFYDFRKYNNNLKNKIINRIRKISNESEYIDYEFKNNGKNIIQESKYRILNNKRNFIYLLEYEKMYTEYIIEFNLVAKATYDNTEYIGTKKIANFVLNTENNSESKLNILKEMFKYNPYIINKINESYNLFRNNGEKKDFFVRK